MSTCICGKKDKKFNFIKKRVCRIIDKKRINYCCISFPNIVFIKTERTAVRQMSGTAVLSVYDF